MPGSAPRLFGTAPSADDFVRIGSAVLAALPEPFASHVRDVPIRIEEFADERTLEDMEIEDPFDLTGLYHGVPVGQREAMALPQAGTDMIFLYRRPILDEWCATGVTLEVLIRHVLIHEIGHHFGLSDEAMAAIEATAADA